MNHLSLINQDTVTSPLTRTIKICCWILFPQGTNERVGLLSNIICSAITKQSSALSTFIRILNRFHAPHGLGTRSLPANTPRCLT